MNTLTNEDITEWATSPKFHLTGVQELAQRLLAAEVRITELDRDCWVYEGTVKNLLERAESAEAQLAESNQKAKNYEEVAHGLSGEVDVLKAQLADIQRDLKETKINLKVRIDLHEETKAKLAALRGQAGKLVGYTSRANIENVTGRNLELFSKEPDVYRVPVALYDGPVPPAASQQCGLTEKDLKLRVAADKYLQACKNQPLHDGGYIDRVVRPLTEQFHNRANAWDVLELLKRLENAPSASQPYTVPDECSFDGLDKDSKDYEVARIVGQVEGWNSYRAAMLQSGNSPVVPDGWQLAPKKPTREMIGATAGKSMTPIECWEVMIAAAPQHKGE